MTSAYRHSYFPPAAAERHRVALASARAGNAIGGGDWTPDQLIPDLVRAFAAGRACPIRSPDGIRPWQFVLEPLRGYLVLAEGLAKQGPAFASAWNLGPAASDARPVSWIADHLVRAWGGSASWTLDRDAHPPEATVLRLDASKAAGTLGWRPALSLEQALDWCVEWYRAWDRGEDLARLTRSQIQRYARLLAS